MTVPDAEYAVRPARAGDRDAVLAFCQHTWEFGDYIDRVWDCWLADPETVLLVAADPADRPVGLGQVRLVSAAEAWLEGLRVDPGIRRRGLAWLIADSALRTAAERGARVVRFATLATNEPMHRLAPQIGFRRVGAFTFWRADPLPAGEAAGWAVGADPPGEVAAFAADQATIRAMGGLISAGWAFAEPVEAVLARWIAQNPTGQIRRPAAGTPRAYAWIEPGEGDQPITITWLATSLADLPEAGRALRRLATERDRPGCHLRLPEGDEFEAAAGAAGFTRLPEPGFWLYARGAG
ncbi:MAG TPA: GNAT family N-acetyltransferase [Dehalococcoidia bacterium]|nr:GNAT family N-acetyltransferase [Dehalococcoidia bacterium]